MAPFFNYYISFWQQEAVFSLLISQQTLALSQHSTFAFFLLFFFSPGPAITVPIAIKENAAIRNPFFISVLCIF